MHNCRLSLPHQHYNNSIKADNMPCDLHLENIYILQLESMDPAKRNGMSIYLDVIVPLAHAWSHPHVYDALHPHLAIFVPHCQTQMGLVTHRFIDIIIIMHFSQVWSHPESPLDAAFSQIYQWTMFGVMSLLECIGEHQQPLLKLDKKPSPQMIELCAMLEHALAYPHTGNAKILSSSLMRPFWLVRSLLQQGWPTMAPIIHLVTTTIIPISVSPADWPVVTCSNLPAIASKHSQIVNYGLDHFKLSISNPNPTAFMQYDQDLHHAIIIAIVAFQTFIADGGWLTA
ncbi:hypothetical protein EDB19DRAFT_2022736 [Suillus lakei]|nr:hypothetical protein EDB19DRAFT_2022736 [Suillus lakei]